MVRWPLLSNSGFRMRKSASVGSRLPFRTCSTTSPSMVSAYATALRRISPIERCLRPNSSDSNLQSVPLPAPGAPALKVSELHKSAILGGNAVPMTKMIFDRALGSVRPARSIGSTGSAVLQDMILILLKPVNIVWEYLCCIDEKFFRNQ